MSRILGWMIYICLFLGLIIFISFASGLQLLEVLFVFLCAVLIAGILFLGAYLIVHTDQENKITWNHIRKHLDIKPYFKEKI